MKFNWSDATYCQFLSTNDTNKQLTQPLINTDSDTSVL